MRRIGLTVLSSILLLSLFLTGCAAPPPAPEKVVETQVVVQTQVVKETQIVQATAEPSTEEYARNETLYSMGKQWGPPPNWNPLQYGSFAMGTIGLCYETLFIYDPLTDKYIPWLAESGDWVDGNTYQLKLRQGINWSDGKPMTIDDVIFTYELGKRFQSVYYSTMWSWLKTIDKVDDNTLKFTFENPLYHEWAYNLFNIAIVPEHLWKDLSEKDAVTGVNNPPVGSGPYLYDTSDQTKMVWVKNDNWWATKALNLNVAPKRVVDIVNISNNVALGMVLQGQVDLSNNYLPGLPSILSGGYGITTYYPDPPYMMSANTAWLVMNLTKKPMDDPAFRKAVAFAIDVNEIVTQDYGNMVLPANPTGLLPIWDQYVDQAVVDKLGFKYDPEQAKKILAGAGYKDVDGDLMFDAADGSKIAVEIGVPNGWSDWMVAIQIISKNLKAVGINVEPVYPDYGALIDGLYSGKFDMVINNDAQMANSPYYYYYYMFYHPIKELMISGTGNYGRYENQAAFDLVDKLNQTPITDIEGMKKIMTEIQTIQLTDLPIIPLWYNGVWSQVSNAVWTNWPSAANEAPHYVPATWNHYWNMGAIFILTELKPAAK